LVSSGIGGLCRDPAVCINVCFDVRAVLNGEKSQVKR